jgi:hypothetical protein
MKAQQRGYFERKRHFTETTRFDPEGTKSRDEPIRDAQIGCTPTRTIQDQYLMFGKNRFGYDCPETCSWRIPAHAAIGV